MNGQPQRDEEDAREVPRLLKAMDAYLPDLLKKTVLLGIGGLFATEESIRKVLGDLRLPTQEARKLVQYLQEQSARSKAELLGLIKGEVKGLLGHLDLSHEMRRALLGLTVHVEADISFERAAEDETPAAPMVQVRTKVVEKKKGRPRRRRS
jgi:hypothetical protein